MKNVGKPSRNLLLYILFSGIVITIIFYFAIFQTPSSELQIDSDESRITPQSTQLDELVETTPGFAIDTSRMRRLEEWNREIREYSRRHYGEDTCELDPKAIVLHYTAGEHFPWNLVDSSEFEGEKPGLAVHYVVDGEKVWRILPDNIRSRGAFGLNHRALNIEMVALDAEDLANRITTMDTCARLVRYLMQVHDIPLNRVYSHQQVSSMDRRIVPEVYDRVDPSPYYKPDPGEENMKYIREKIKSDSMVK